jgi:hypothetical protein
MSCLKEITEDQAQILVVDDSPWQPEAVHRPSRASWRSGPSCFMALVEWGELPVRQERLSQVNHEDDIIKW